VSAHDDTNPPGSRRAFLRKLALAGALTTLPGFALTSNAAPTPAAGPNAAAREAITVAALLPQSTLHPSIDHSFLAGMRLGFAHTRSASMRPIAIVEAPYGRSPAQALSHARALVADTGVDLLTGVLSANGVTDLAPLLAERGRLMVASDVGANVLNRRSEHPALFRNSLGYWQSNLALGGWAAAQLGQRAVIASSFYDSGYDSIYAFRQGFEGSGGTVAETVFTHHPAHPRDLALALDTIAALQPDVVYAAYSGHRAADFLRAYADSRLAGRVPLVGPGMLADESLLAEAGSAALGVRTALSWSLDLPSAHNQRFVSAARQAGATADPFAVLGYDAALLIAQALDSVHDDPSDTAGLARAMTNFAAPGPRGQLSMQAATREIASPLYLREVRQGVGGLANIAIAELPAIAASDARVGALRSDVRSGWINGYLCV
jgi:branched-chain amino acid transport system substrate-binding protein